MSGTVCGSDAVEGRWAGERQDVRGLVRSQASSCDIDPWAKIRELLPEPVLLLFAFHFTLSLIIASDTKFYSNPATITMMFLQNIP